MTFLRTLSLLSLTFSLAHAAPTWKLVWETTNLPNPESVVHDDVLDVLFVSHQDFSGRAGGSVGKMRLDGTVINNEWVKGLRSPKGIAIRGRTMFVSDVSELVEIDIDSARITNRYPGVDAGFLNDVVVGSDGAIYVSDMGNSAIYKLDDQGDFKVWLTSPELDDPNGLLAREGELILAGWGGHLVSVSLADQKITRLSPTASVGSLDGIQELGDGQLLVSDWSGGDIYVFDLQHRPTKVLDLESSLGDIAYSNGLLIMPFARQGKVSAYRLRD